MDNEKSKTAIEQQWPVFSEEVQSRLNRGAEEYGDASFERAADEIAGEIGQEIADICGWSFILYCRLGVLKERLRRLEAMVSLPPSQPAAGTD